MTPDGRESLVVHLWRHQRPLLAASAVAVGLVVFFAVRLLVSVSYWSYADSHDQALAGWMTPRYVAHSWHVPPEVVGEALGLEPQRSGRPPTFDSIAAERGVPVETINADVAAAIARYRAEHP